MMKRLSTSLVLSLLASARVGFAQATTVSTTPKELVAAYENLADAILAAKKTERELVRSILASTYNHAEAVFARAKSKIQAGQDARSEVEGLAALVGQLGNEGDAAVAGVRKRLVEGGHHHNAAAEQRGIYDEGFVIVTRVAKKVFLDAASDIGKLAGSPNASALDSQWQKVKSQFAALEKP